MISKAAGEARCSPPGKTKKESPSGWTGTSWFRAHVEERGGGNDQTLINQALREPIAREDRPLEDVIRRVVREELQNVRTP